MRAKPNGAGRDHGCVTCAVLATVEDKKDPWVVARLTTGYFRLNPVQHHRGAAVFVTKACVQGLHELSEPVRIAHLAEMAQVAEALRATLAPERLSCEAPSHIGGHLQWWLTPRYADDAYPTGSIWQNPDFLHSYWTGGDDQPHRDVRRELCAALDRVNLTIERCYVA